MKYVLSDWCQAGPGLESTWNIIASSLSVWFFLTQNLKFCVCWSSICVCLMSDWHMQLSLYYSSHWTSKSFFFLYIYTYIWIKNAKQSYLFLWYFSKLNMQHNAYCIICNRRQYSGILFRTDRIWISANLLNVAI